MDAIKTLDLFIKELGKIRISTETKCAFVLSETEKLTYVFFIQRNTRLAGLEANYKPLDSDLHDITIEVSKELVYYMSRIGIATIHNVQKREYTLKPDFIKMAINANIIAEQDI